MDEMERSSISSMIAASSGIGLQYPELYVQYCAPDDGRNMYSVCRNKYIKKSCILLVVIWNYDTNVFKNSTTEKKNLECVGNIKLIYRGLWKKSVVWNSFF